MSDTSLETAAMKLIVNPDGCARPRPGPPALDHTAIAIPAREPSAPPPVGGRTRNLRALGVPGRSDPAARRILLSIVRTDADRPNPLVNVAYLGTLSLAAGVTTLGLGLRRAA